MLLSLFITSVLAAQNPVYTATINNTELPEVSRSFQVKVAGDKTTSAFSLWIQNPDKKRLKLQIKHRALGVLVDTTIYNEDFERRYNMDMLDDGRYTVKVSCGKERVIKEIEINTITTRNVVVR